MMKTFMILLLAILPFIGNSQKTVNLDSLSDQRRTKYLLKDAKRVVMRHGPDYYREVKPPVIKRVVVGKNDTTSSGRMRLEHEGRAYYIVEYPHDPTYEYMHAGFAARVCVWPDTGIAFRVVFGNDWGYVEIDHPEWYEGEERVMKYEWQPPRQQKKSE